MLHTQYISSARRGWVGWKPYSLSINGGSGLQFPFGRNRGGGLYAEGCGELGWGLGLKLR
jgi:hypothetical protein